MRFRVTICYDVEALEAPEALHLCTALAIPGLCFVGAEVHPALLQETPKVDAGYSDARGRAHARRH